MEAPHRSPSSLHFPFSPLPPGPGVAKDSPNLLRGKTPFPPPPPHPNFSSRFFFRQFHPGHRPFFVLFFSRFFSSFDNRRIPQPHGILQVDAILFSPTRRPVDRPVFALFLPFFPFRPSEQCCIVGSPRRRNGAVLLDPSRLFQTLLKVMLDYSVAGPSRVAEWIGLARPRGSFSPALFSFEQLRFNHELATPPSPPCVSILLLFSICHCTRSFPGVFFRPANTRSVTHVFAFLIGGVLLPVVLLRSAHLGIFSP